MSLPKSNGWKINGPVSVVPVTRNLGWSGFSYKYLIMGPTGAGKSSFIEALAGNSYRLKISGNQLASVTQRVTAYELVNATRYDDRVCIIDTPGFSDSKISEREIVDMVKEWMKDNGIDLIDYVLFLTPITATRMAGSKRRTLKMLRELLSDKNGRPGGMTFVTTMWDQVSNESAQQRAESNFTQLEKVVLKDWIDDTASKLTKFKNNQSSALKALYSCNSRGFHFSRRPAILYHDLHERISTALQEKQMIKEQLTNPNNNNALNTILKQNHTDNEDLLVKLIGRLKVYYVMAPQGYEVAHAELTAAISALGDELGDMKRRVQERRELDRRELERRELERRELKRRELKRRELKRRELERRELERRELERRDLERREMEQRELEQRELERRDLEQRELERCELEQRSELERRELERRDMEQRELEKRELEQRELERRELERRDLEQRELEERELEQRSELERRELERQRLVRESKLSFRLRQKIEQAKTSFTDIFKCTS